MASLLHCLLDIFLLLQLTLVKLLWIFQCYKDGKKIKATISSDSKEHISLTIEISDRKGSASKCRQVLKIME
jgi:hypothetical protein